ncbi:phospholipid N-methyltransferase [Tamaricihabitans halophyticus]|uniref:Phospholipid N-methyltransferase n=1 Tax=Tamaricihabitans halophyticus TaxID=1262583 RepID=A0A4R2QQN3_9PSEU|nr:phospholipid N-methyltransferase [Tamaricihabitans halophyticus]
MVELGPGTGATSAAIEQQLPAGGRHLGVECDPGLAAYLRRSQHRMEVVQGDAAELGQLLAEQGVDKVDVIISGLPWALFPLEQQNQILTQITEVLRPDGVFTSFAYLHALPTARAKQFRASLQARFEEVLITSPVWRNAPPALTYVCRRPITD